MSEATSELDERYERIRVTTDGSTRTIALAYPERRNAIGPLMTNELLYALEGAENDDGVRAIVITGEGKAFCAGGDFAQMTGGSDAPVRPPKGDYADLLVALWKAKKPVVARVNGHAMGGGLGIVAASTFAVAVAEAKLGTPEVDVGLFPMMIMAVLSRLMPRRRLVQMMLLGEKLSAEEAMAAGIVGRVVPPAELDSAVSELTRALAGKSPITLRLGLKALADSEELDLEKALPLLRERLGECLATDDAREGLTAFLQKRAPVWTGR
jgi:enoyl-CoA hydratase/carnithine racemase